jgi:hypothetical protein
MRDGRRREPRLGTENTPGALLARQAVTDRDPDRLTDNDGL